MDGKIILESLKAIFKGFSEIIIGLFNFFKPGIILGVIILIGWIIYEICRPLFPLIPDDKYGKWFLGVITALTYIILFISHLLSSKRK